MQQLQFEQMVARLEIESATSPGLYQFKVAGLALLGFLIIGLIIGFASLGLLLIVGIAVATLLTGGKALILLFKLGKLLLLLAIPLWLLVKSSSKALFTRLPAPQGLALQRDQAPALFSALDEIRQRMKGPRFHHVLITHDLNAAVVQRPLFGLAGWPRNYLILGLPLLEALSPEEATAVVAHEYGHLAGSHGRFAAFIYRLRLTWGLIQALSQQWQGWATWPLRRIVQWYAPYFNAYTFVLARANEYQADSAAAELIGADVAASALKRVSIVSNQYDTFVEQTFDGVRDNEAPPDDVAHQWADCVHHAPLAEQARQWLNRALLRESQVSDTHPVLRERLRALPGQADLTEQLPAPLPAASAATTWFGESAPALRSTLQREWHAQMAPPWAERHRELQARLRRLDEIEALAEPGVDEQIERLGLRTSLYPRQDHVQALADFNASHANRPVTVFLEGCARLDRDDEGGLALLEQAIALDADASRPASEKAHAYLARRNDPRSAAWAERWRQRLAFEETRASELNTFDARHELQAAVLTPQQLDQVRAALRQGGADVARAYLVRRVLPSDPDLATFVLGFELKRWPGLRGKGAQTVKRLAALEWPMHVFICELAGKRKALRKKLKAIPAAELAFDR